LLNNILLDTLRTIVDSVDGDVEAMARAQDRAP
jgi:hypothetical protein